MARRRKPTQSRVPRRAGRGRAKDLGRTRGEERAVEARAFTHALEDAARLIERLGYPAAIIGAVAVIAHGFPRATADIDLAVAAPPGDLERLIASARAVGFRPRIDDAVEFARMNAVLLLEHESGFPLDLTLATQEFEERALTQRVTRTIGETAIEVAPLGAMLVYKMVASRPKDLEDVRALIATGQAFDRNEVERTLAEFDAILETDRLNEFRRLLDGRVARVAKPQSRKPRRRR